MAHGPQLGNEVARRQVEASGGVHEGDSRDPASDVHPGLPLHGKRLERESPPGSANQNVQALSRCRAQARRVAPRLMSGRDTSRIAPCLERLGSEEAVCASRDEMTRDGEEVVGGRVQGQEPLG